MVVPSLPGTYVLIISLGESLSIARPRKTVIPPGVYVYVGSALGPGGLKARLKRHFSSRKTSRWHIDQLTAKVKPAVVVYGVSSARLECEVVKRLLSGFFQPAVRGFGSSDCKGGCPSHLLRFNGSILECVSKVIEASGELGIREIATAWELVPSSSPRA